MSDIDAWLGQSAPAQGAASSAPAQSIAPVDAWLGASAPGVATMAPPAMLAPQVQQPGNAQDLAMGGASPDTLTQLGQIASAGAHGIGSMFNNAANFVERQAARVGIFPQTAARDTAIQAQNDQQFAQNASPGEKAAAFVAPMLLPMSGAMAPGNALKAGLTTLPRMGGTVGRVIATGAGNALNGGLMATGTPIDPNQATGPQDLSHLLTGAALGVAIPAALGGGLAIGNALYNTAMPAFAPGKFVGQGLAGAMTPGDAASVAANIRNAPVFTPGYQPSSAQLGGSPFLVQTEKAAGNLPAFKTAAAQRGVENNATLWNALNGIAGTTDDLNNAIAQRTTATTPLYNVAKQQNIPVDAPMTDLLNRPAMQSAVKRAQTLADNTNAGPIFQTTPLPNMLNGGPSSMTTLNGNGAQAIKESLDALLLPENTQKLSAKEIGALNDTRAAYISWLEGHSPEFTQARQTFATMSPPINTMQAAQQIQERLGGLGRSLDTNNNPIITGPGYATALSRALGNQEFGIDPQAQTALENIGRDLQRSTISNSVKSPGSDTAYNLAANGWLARNLYGPAFEGATGLGKGLGAIGALATGHPFYAAGILGGGNKLGQIVGGRLQNELSGLLLNPETLLPYLDARAAAPVNIAPQAFGGLLQRNILPAAIGGVSRMGLINAQ